MFLFAVGLVLRLAAVRYLLWLWQNQNRLEDFLLSQRFRPITYPSKGHLLLIWTFLLVFFLNISLFSISSSSCISVYIISTSDLLQEPKIKENIFISHVNYVTRVKSRYLQICLDTIDKYRQDNSYYGKKIICQSSSAPTSILTDFICKSNFKSGHLLI